MGIMRKKPEMGMGIETLERIVRSLKRPRTKIELAQMSWDDQEMEMSRNSNRHKRKRKIRKVVRT